MQVAGTSSTRPYGEASCSTSETADATMLALQLVRKSRQRHCSFAMCLKTCTVARMCGKCQKRAYCSRECQAQDWPRHGAGQGHKDWCGHQCGEEDVDWQVTPVPGKGLGIVAKKNMPAGFRIMVEHAFTDPCGHPAMQDLMPHNGTLTDKFQFNAFRNHSGTIPWFVSLRMSRLNHDCNANATIYWCRTTKVGIVVAQRHIEIGQEICVAYDSLYVRFNMAMALSANTARQQMEKYLFEKKGIICRPNCVCKCERTNELITRVVQLFSLMKEMIQRKQVLEFSQPGDELLDIVDSIPLDPYSSVRLEMYNLLYDFEVHQAQHLIKFATTSLRETWCAATVAKLQQYTASAYEIQSAMSPYCALTEKCEEKFAVANSTLQYL